MFIWLLQSKVRSLLEKLEKLVDKNCWRPDKQPGGGGWEGKFKKEVLDNWFGRQGGVSRTKHRSTTNFWETSRSLTKTKTLCPKSNWLLVGFMVCHLFHFICAKIFAQVSERVNTTHSWIQWNSEDSISQSMISQFDKVTWCHLLYWKPVSRHKKGLMNLILTQHTLGNNDLPPAMYRLPLCRWVLLACWHCLTFPFHYNHYSVLHFLSVTSKVMLHCFQDR